MDQEYLPSSLPPNTFQHVCGTGGKTLLGRGVAGEAGVPFFYASGSEFEEVYVGVGAKRMRSLFEAARKHAPCIIFIDEIDAVGGKRNPRDSQSSKMTLNQMLVEMDGFRENDSIVVIGATNTPDLLDAALTRPGRFDRHVVVQAPDVKGRQQILNLYLDKVKIDSLQKRSIVDTIARGTPGFTGAELENLVNQASIRAITRGGPSVELEDLEYARERVLMGSERRHYRTTEKSRECTAHHEAGHALVAALTKGADPVYKATILPRGQALGMVQQLPEDDQYSFSYKMMLARLDVIMAGRVAEEMLLGEADYTSGASSDLDQATRLARAMVMQWGLSPRVGPVHYSAEDEPNMSAQTKHVIEEEVNTLLKDAYERAKQLITAKRSEHLMLAKALLERETLNGDEIVAIVSGGKGPKPQLSPSSTSDNKSSKEHVARAPS
eukprot:c20419_g1_i1.p1 GENE.c20419_g1_i1~~c20419_g1_i1.p1  ORF type:complete len:439 (-),score=91.09 c20419_g1_i1:168-1484(-)